MRNKYMLIGIGIVVGVLLSSAVFVLAGNPDSPGAPGATNSFTLEDIYNRLNAGAAGAQSTFTEPAAGPGTGTMHTLNEIMGKAPAADNTNGVTTAQVLTGKTFWGLRTDGTWGTKTGIAAAGNNVNGADGAKTFNIPDGFYSGKTCTANDAQLVAGNIAQGVNIFGVAGSALLATGDATAGDVLTGKTFSNAGAAGIAGTMPDREGDNASTAQAQSVGVNYFTAPAGYYDGDDRVSATDAEVAALDADVAAGNIKSGENIFGVGGTLTPGGTATAADLLDGKTAHLASDWTLDTGTLDLACNTATFNGAANQVADAYDGGGNGTNRWCMKETGDAAAADIASGKKAWVDGVELTGTGTIATYAAAVPKTGQTDCYYDEMDQQEPVHVGLRIVHQARTATWRKGVAWPNPRFTDNSDGTVTDNLTGLIWLDNANCANATRTWSTALSDVVQLNTDGTMNGNNCGDTSNSGSHQTDWRLPNVRELQSLVHYGVYDPVVPNTAGTGQWKSGDPFDNVQSDDYWSSTTRANDTDGAWYVHLRGGLVDYVEKVDDSYVWLVRGGQ